ncbi:DsbA family protein [Peribacillus acanthi]|uniref:DsbA family protein n=1 Tax=Peribacillus acanthi TaxID=2171554 RepID=UPI000D3EC4E0|nr:DsbA family protein [Peribacillus acanthi]
MGKSTKSPFKIIVLLTLVTFSLIVAFVVFNQKDKEPSVTTFQKQPDITGQPTIGNSDAPISIVEFGDFKCPSCKAWGETIFPQLAKDYVTTGQAKITYINVLFHGEESKLGSLAAESVFKNSPDSYWEFHIGLFNEQPTENHDGLWITKEKILEVAKQVKGIDIEKLSTDIDAQSGLEELNKDTNLVKEYKVEMTPSIMVNGTMLEDPFDYEKIKSLIKKELEENK